MMIFRRPSVQWFDLCYQTVYWCLLVVFIGDIGVLAIKMTLGLEVALGPNDIVLDGDPVHPHQKRGTAPSFWPCLLWPNGWMDQDIT